MADAIAKFPGAVKEALEQAIEEAREFRRESASRIVVPDVAGGRAAPHSRRRQDQALIDCSRLDGIVVRSGCGAAPELGVSMTGAASARQASTRRWDAFCLQLR